MRLRTPENAVRPAGSGEPAADSGGSGKICRACGGRQAEPFFTANGVPANSCLLIPSREEALAWPRGDIVLTFCADCGFIGNRDFDPRLTEYSDRYEETQGYSPTFRVFQEKLAAELVDRHRLQGRTVLEIGCGKGEFLSLLCALGGNRGLGFDPAFVETRRPQGDFRVIPDFFSQKYAHFKTDFVCCKMTLEHIAEPASLVQAARRVVGEGGVAFFQIPDATRILRQCAFEDIYYEHCSYFSPESLVNLFARCGFDILRLEKAYDHQYLTVEARPAPAGRPLPVPPDLSPLRQWTAGFSGRFERSRQLWRRRLDRMHAAGRRMVLWGSGSKAVAFLAALGAQKEIPFVVDINPYRQNSFIAGSGLPIVAPEFLREYRPQAVIIMNAVYREEIHREVSRLGLSPELLTLEATDVI